MINSDFITILDSNGLAGASIAFTDLPIDLQQNLQQCANVDCQNQFINVVANLGSRFWTNLQSSEFKNDPNPVDVFSHALAEQMCKTSDAADQCEIIYPSSLPVPLMQLGKLLGWSSPSPLGLGLHPDYGPWFAYRAVIVSPKPLHTKFSGKLSLETVSLGSTCINCSAPCVTACPVNAVSKSNTFNIERCANHRLQTGSSCANTCHARYACPIGQQHQYSDEQISHHMSRSLVSLANWFRASGPR